MIWKKKKDAAAQSAAAAGEMTGAKGRTGAGAFAKKNWKWLVPLVVVAAAGAVFLIGGGRNGAASRDVTYAETTPVRQDVSNSLCGTGTLNPAKTYTVKSLVDGKILTGGFEEGDKVEEGDVLYTIDSSDASTNLEKASIALQQAQRSYDKTVDRQFVHAEVDGTVSSLKVAKGDEVTSGQEVAVIRDSSKMTLQLEFPAADAASFSVGQSAEVTLEGTFATITGPVPASKLEGEIEYLRTGEERQHLSKDIDTNTRMVVGRSLSARMAAQRSLFQTADQSSVSILPSGAALSQLWQGMLLPSGAMAMLLRQAPQLGISGRPRARSVSSGCQPGLVKSSSMLSSSSTETAPSSTAESSCSVRRVARLSAPSALPEGIRPEQVA